MTSSLKKLEEYGLKATNNKITNEKLITSLSEYLEYVKIIRDVWEVKDIWFRGVTKENHNLKPTLYRNESLKNDPQKAVEFYMEFSRKSHAYLKERHDEFEIYQLMQHYGAPTRLLDWTESPLIALFFALYSDNAYIPSIWTIDPYWLNYNVIGEPQVLYFVNSRNYQPSNNEQEKEEPLVEKYINNEGRYLKDYPIAVLPTFIDKRIVAQKSCFTIHGRLMTGFERIFKETEHPRILQIRFSTKKIHDLKEELVLAGISHSSVFPDLEGLVNEIKYEYNNR